MALWIHIIGLRKIKKLILINFMKKEYKICIVGLGYVGLPLAIEFAKKYSTIGYDINKRRIGELNNCYDSTLEVTQGDLDSVLVNDYNDIRLKNGFYVTDRINQIKDCNIYIITVPTPIDKQKQPVLKPLINASEQIGKLLKKHDIVIYESTVYPGLTEDVCVPLLEKNSGLEFNIDFSVGYSPERINPGDKKRTITKILKVTSGSNPKAALEIDQLYKTIINAGTHLAPSIKVAEAAKVIENSQRDINIAFVNELAKIFNLLNINTNDVLEAASTKWNFLPFKPGLVGGHCIGVDPYYLAHKSVEVGYKPEIILSGRKLNDSMSLYVANQILDLMVKNNIKIKNSNLLVLGITFKENCPDIRNTKVADLIIYLKDFGINVNVFDPHADPIEVKNEYNIISNNEIPKNKFDAIVLAVTHNEFLSLDLKTLQKKESIIYDVKGILGKISDGKL